MITSDATRHPRHRLYLLGGASVIGPDGPLGALALDDHLIAMLALLATAPEGAANPDAVATTLRPTMDAAEARRALDADLERLGREIGDGAVRVASGAMELDPDTIWCDVISYRANLAAGDRLAAAADYQGPFLDRFHLAEAAAFNQWMHSERAAFALAFRELAAALAAEAMAARDGRAAARWWTRLVDADPWNPRAALQAIDGFEAMGERPAAMAVAVEFLERTGTRLGREADPAIAGRLAQLRDAPPRGARPITVMGGVVALLAVLLLLLLLAM